jgi:hypothetical protein
MKRFALAALLLIATMAHAGKTTTPGYTCSLTGKKIAACCCKPTKDGKLYCTLAKKKIDSCCCKATAAE